MGTPMAGRNRPEMEGLIGCFVNTLRAARPTSRGSPSFRGAAGRVRQAALGAYAHQEVPFEQLVEALQPARDLSRTPVFQVVLGAASTRPCPELTLAAAARSAVEVHRHRQVRPDARAVRSGATGLALHLRVRHRPVRRGHDRAAWPGTCAALLEAAVAAARSAAVSQPAAAHRGRAPAGARGVERHPGGLPAATPASTRSSRPRPARTPDAVAVELGASSRLTYASSSTRAPTSSPTTCAPWACGPSALVGLCLRALA